jgi:hypothetical protein
MTAKEEFKIFCEHNNLPLFNSYWWWANVVKSNWEVLLYKKGSQVLACFPYHFRKKMGVTAIIPPILTPYQGIGYAHQPGAKMDKTISFYRKAQEAIIDQLPSNSLFIRQFDSKTTYLLPFYWKVFDLKVRYTYLLPTEKEATELYSDLKDTLRREIGKAKGSLMLSDSSNPRPLFELKKQNNEQSGEPLPYDLDYLKRICQLIESKNAHLFEAKENDQTVAALLVTWDTDQLYYTCGATHPDYRNSGALSWLLWEAILKAKSLQLTFNFEGSMIPAIERYFASFGGIPTPFIEVRKISNKVLEPILKKF